MEIKDVLVLIADGVPDIHGEVCNVEDIQLRDKPVPVTLDFNPLQILGLAHLRKEGNCVYADMELICISNPQESNQTVKDLIPAICGNYTFKTCNSDKIIYGCTITGIALCTTGNTDQRICKIGLTQHEAFRQRMGLDKERFIFCSDVPMKKLLSKFWFPDMPRPNGMTPQEFLKACGLEIYYDPSAPSDELQFGYTVQKFGCDCKVVTRRMKVGDLRLMP